jgi:hypothetical protein
VHHSGFAALYEINLGSLSLYWQISVKDAYTALTGHGDRHSGFGDSIHGTGHQWHFDRNIFGNKSGSVDLTRHDVGDSRQQQDVIKGEAQECNLARSLNHGTSSRIKP